MTVFGDHYVVFANRDIHAIQFMLEPKKFKRHDRNDGGKTHIGYIANEVLKAIPKEFEHVVSKDREYLGLNYLVLPVLVHKAVLELNDKTDKLEKEIKELKKEKSK